ncbi:MAG: DUF2752 domain-containing protein [Drouetiella hepatica Uher 2000/2452]|jgi:hypothetical protein|uniref:DUF2752 domain-containing protein n=1 Tax=Drouetiella hepatica Uher 2000/2452 TaxID=904376 RepID=A0A951QC79_9CYAN|nr:DUF2752 domain-containing protein [Drouetiella hepatica Uher 2000/2452]
MIERRIKRSPTLSSSSVWIRWAILGLSLAPVIGAFLYNEGLRLTPQKCFFQQLLGFPSPGCGMTRSFMAIVRGDWQQALTYHLFAPFLFGICLVVAFYAAIELMAGRRLTDYGQLSFLNERYLILIAIGILLFFGYYALRMYARYGNGLLPFDLADTILWQQLTLGAKAL